MNRLSGRKMGKLYGARKWNSTELFRKSERVWEPRDRELTEGSENSEWIVAPAGKYGVATVSRID